MCSSYAIYNYPIKSQFCTCHDSWAVVTCVKFWRDFVIIIKVKTSRIFTRFQLCAHKVFVKWVSDLGLPLPYASFPRMQIMAAISLCSNLVKWDNCKESWKKNYYEFITSQGLLLFSTTHMPSAKSVVLHLMTILCSANSKFINVKMFSKLICA